MATKVNNQFSNTIYYRAIQDKRDCDLAAHSLNVPGLIVSFAAYTQHYSSDGWLYRKVEAIPMAVISLCNLLERLIANQFIMECAKQRVRKEYQAYWLMTAGSVITLFNDRAGQWLAQKGQFELEHASLYHEQHRRYTLDYDTTPEAILSCIEENPENHSLRYIPPCLSSEQWEQLDIDRLTPEQFRSLFDDRYWKWEEVSKPAFARIPLKVIYRALETGKFNKFRLLAGLLSEEHWAQLDFHLLTQDNFKLLFESHTPSELKAPFAHLTPEAVNQAFKEGKFLGCSEVAQLLSDNQWEHLELESLSPEDLKNLFGVSFGFFTEREKGYFAHISSAHVNRALKTGKLDDLYVLDLLSEEHIHNLELSSFSPKTLENLLPLHAFLRRNIVPLIPIAEIDRFIKTIECPKLLVGLQNGLSNQQLRELKLSTFSKTQLEFLFFYGYPKKSTITKERFARISPEEVGKASRKGLFEHSDCPWAKLFSKAQKAASDMDRVTKQPISSSSDSDEDEKDSRTSKKEGVIEACKNIARQIWRQCDQEGDMPSLNSSSTPDEQIAWFRSIHKPYTQKLLHTHEDKTSNPQLIEVAKKLTSWMKDLEEKVIELKELIPQD